MAHSDAVYERLLQHRIIVLDQALDDDAADRIAGQMLSLAAEDSLADISFYINSPGGSVTAGMAIWDTMEFLECLFATYAMGLAAGMAQVLLSAGTPGKRYALADAKIFMAEPSGGVAEAGSVIPDNVYRTRQLLADMTAQHTGQALGTILRDWARARVFDAQEAMEYGLVDHVVSRAPDLRPSDG